MIDPTNLKDLKIKGGITTGFVKTGGNLYKSGQLAVISDGLSTFLDYVERKFPGPAQAEKSSRYGKTITAGFFGTETYKFHEFDTYEETLDVFRHNPGSLVKYDQTELNPTQYDESGNDVEYDVVGDFVDVGRYLEGVPEAMGSMHNGRTRNRRVRLVVDDNQVWDMDEGDIRHRSERVIRLIDALEASRVRTELNVLKLNQCVYIDVKVKRFDEPLTLEDVAIATHPDFSRRLGFRVAEHSPTWQEGYGSSDWLTDRAEYITNDLNDEITVFIDGSIEGKGHIDDLFNKLETMLIEELSQPQPTNNLFLLRRRSVEAKQS